MADNVISKIKLPDNQEYILKDSNAARSDHTHDIALEKDTSGTNQLTLAAGTKYKLTAGGESYIFTTPADANNKVTIAADTTTNANYPLVFGSTNTSTTTAKTEGLQKNTTKFYVNPSTGNIQATTFNGIALTAAAGKSITDNSSNADVTSSDTNLITGRTLYYQLAKKGYTTNTGTVTNVATGAGLTGGPIATTGTIKANLTSETKLTNAAADGTETAGRVYPVRLDKDGKLAVNVPWTNSNGNYLTGVTTTGSGNAITAVEKNGQSLTFTKGTTFLTAHRTYTQFTGNPTSNQAPAFGSTFTIQQISQATTGQVSGTDRTVTIPGTIAANNTKGLIKPWYNHTKASTGPTAGSNATAVAVNAISSTAGKYYAVEIDSEGRLFANVPWTDTVTSVNGKTGNVTAADLGLASALKYVGSVSSLPAATNATTYSTYNNGDVITVNYKEYAYVKGTSASNSNWTELGDEGSYKTKQTAVTNATAETTTATTFVHSVTQDVNGVITVKTRPLPTYNNYSLSVAKYNTLGGLKPAYTSTNAAKLTTTAATNTDTPTIAAKTNTTGKYYAVEADKNGVAYVNVPWTDNNTTYSAGTGISLSGTTFSNSGVTGVKGNSESNFRTGQVNITPANIGAVSKNDTLMTTNPFAPNSLKGPYISKIDNALYAADKRWNVTATGSYSNNLANLFDGSYETRVIISNGNTVVITIDFSNESDGYFPGYPYGYFYISHYHVSGPSSITGRVYCNYEAHGIGWHDISFSPISDNTTSAITYVGYNGYFNISKVEFTIVGSTSNSAGNTKISQIELKLDRPHSTRTPFLSKYGPERLYYNLTAPNFIGNVIGSVTGNVSGTASNITGTVAIANGGTGKTTALDAANALISGLPVWTANPTDDTYLIRRNTDGTATFGQAKFSTVWNYIKGKADSTYLKLTGGTITGRLTAPEINATRPMIISAGKIYSNITGSNALIPAKTSMLFSDGVAIASPGLTVANDVGWIRMLGADENTGILEIATGDDGGSSTGEKIVVRQYNTSNTIAKEAVLLDKQTGATSFPVSVTAPSFIGNLTGHASSDLALTGGKMTGRIYREGVSTSWNKGRDNALVATSTLNGYSPFASIKTTNGSWDIGAYDNGSYLDDLVFSYVPDTLYSGTNTTPTQIKFLENGHIIAALDGNATSATTATNLASKPSLAVSDTSKITVTAGGKTSDAFTVPYATSAGSAAAATTATNLSAAPTITATGTATVNLAANTAYTLTVGGKSVVFKTPSDANTNTLVNYTLGETTKAYLMASQNAPTTTTTARAAHGDTGVYLTATAGELSAMRHSYNVAGAERAYTHYNMTDQSIDFIFV